MRCVGVDPCTDDIVITATPADPSRTTFALIGDPGEGDFSQDVVIPPLLSLQGECEFLVICSDVVYPAGDVNEYEDKFYEPYREWLKPIYALPGNHDWYDELEGFMFHFCGAEPPPTGGDGHIDRPPLWRKPRSPKAGAYRCRERRPASRGAFQPAPYFVVDAGPIALVCVDTGIKGNLDRSQGEWLLRVSRNIDKPKVLLTGKPLIVDGSYDPGRIASFDRTVDDIVRDADHGYVAAVGGDIHNYQRYPVAVRDRSIEYIVSGGGGAFMHATHRIDRVDLGGVDEPSFRCFPLRGDSLWFYSRILIPALRRLVRTSGLLLGACLGAFVAITTLLVIERSSVSTWILCELVLLTLLGMTGVLWQQVTANGASEALRVRPGALTHEQAESWMAQRIGEEPTIGEAGPLSEEGRAVASFVAPRLRATGGFLQSLFSEIFDVDRAPLYKHFLRFDAEREMLKITCCAAIGVQHEANGPYIEERIEIPLAPARAEMAGGSAATPDTARAAEAAQPGSAEL